ncbi:MAG: LuxR family transcriptional regulator [Labilithrix sp.]
MNLEKIFDGLERFATADDPTAVTRALERSAAELGFGSFIYALRVPESLSDARVLQVKGYPESWLGRYWERDYHAIDPVIAHCTRSVLPVAWERLTPGMSAAGHRMMLEAGEFGLAHGASTGVHGPSGELGILSFARDRGRSSLVEQRHTLRATQLLAPHVHEAVRRVFGLSAPTVQLRKREEECLAWAAEGKTSWEISLLLEISERTVNFHLDNAVAKLGASNRQHAIARAIASRMLRPRPF